MKSKKECPRCGNLMDWVERVSKPPFNLGTLECWKCNKIIQGIQSGDEDPIDLDDYNNLSKCCREKIATSPKGIDFCSKCKKEIKKYVK